MLNGFAVSAFAQNIGLIALTRVRSRYVGGVVLILLGLFPVAGAVVAIVPQPVLGGRGVRAVRDGGGERDQDAGAGGAGDSNNLLIVAVAVGRWCGLCMAGRAVPRAPMVLQLNRCRYVALSRGAGNCATSPLRSAVERYADPYGVRQQGN